MSSLMGHQVGVQTRKFKRLILPSMDGLAHAAHAPLGVNNHGPEPHEGWGNCGGSHPRKAAAGAGFHGPFAQGAFARRQQSSNTSSGPCRHQGRNRDVRLWFTCGSPMVRL